ncbi:peptidoglycan editing factor PgeF [Acididesulfobacillus acetoxydans]
MFERLGAAISGKRTRENGENGEFAMEWKWVKEGQAYLRLDWEEEQVEAGFSVREGGVSTGAFASLNLGFHVGDEAAAVLVNRERWLGVWGAGRRDAVVGEQVHGTEVVWVTEAEAGRGSGEIGSALPGADGLLTQSSLGLMAFFADCTPLYFYDPKIRAVGLAHAGWRGTAGKIGLRVLEALAKRGGKSGDVRVAVGPSIGPCCYEVDERVAAYFRREFSETPFLKATRPGHYRLDLWQANIETLVGAGVLPGRIATAGLCTSCHPEYFYSHRRDGVPTGRMAAWIRLKPAAAEA